jgi:hypothetical protein
MNRMPSVTLTTEVATAEWKVDTRGNAAGTAGGTVRLSNPSQQLAFFVRVRMLEESETLRTTYSDNYVSLLPGESKTIAVRVEIKGEVPETLHFDTTGWNCPAQRVEIRVK